MSPAQKATPFEVLAFSLYAITTLVSMAAMNIGFGILLIALIVGMKSPAAFLKEIVRLLKHPRIKLYGIASIVLTVALAISLIWAKVSPMGYDGKFVEVSFFKDIAKVWYFILPIVLLLGLRRLNDFQKKTVLRSWLIAFGILSVIGIVQYFTGWPRPQVIPGHSPERFHATLFLGHHLSVASIFIFPFFVCLDALRKALLKKEKPLLPITVLLGIAALGLATLFLTYSRMLWVALPVGILCWSFWVLPKKISISAVVALLLVGVGLFQTPSIQNRIKNKMGVGPRFELWEANWKFFQERPLTGVGWRKNHLLSGYYLKNKYPWKGWFIQGHAHNNVIDMLGNTGIIGLLSWFFWWFAVLMVIWISLKKPATLNFGIGLFCAWIVFHINGLTQVNGWEAKVQHQMMLVLAWAMFWVLKNEKLKSNR